MSQPHRVVYFLGEGELFLAGKLFQSTDSWQESQNVTVILDPGCAPQVG